MGKQTPEYGMMISPRRKMKIKDNRGSIAIVIGLTLVMLMGFGALTVDIGYSLNTKAELQNVADAAVLAGTRQLGLIYEGLVADEQKPTWVMSGADQTTIVSQVQAVALLNEAGATPITINASDIQIGQWDYATKTFTETTTAPIAVRAVARRDSNANGPITTFLAGILGTNTVDVTAIATASLGGMGSSLPGEIEVPFGVAEYWFSQKSCGESIRFHPTGDLDGCAGWHTLDLNPPNAHTLAVDVIDAMTAGTFESTATVAGETQYEYVGGNVASAFDNFMYDSKKDPITGEWPVTIPVYEWNDCSNPNTAITIAGYAKAVITNVIPPPDMQIDAYMDCGYVEGGRSGGTNFGIMGSVPGLVQ
jgi:Flp pilus assembly protein TadG